MINIVLKVILISLFCNGLYLFIGNVYEMATGKNIDWLYTDAPKWRKYIYKPLFYCINCTASIWGTTAYLLLWQAGYEGNVYEWAITIPCVSIMNGITYKLWNN